MSDEYKGRVIYAEAKAYVMANPGVKPAQIRQLFPTVTPTQSRKLSSQSKQASSREYREEANRKRLRDLAARSLEKRKAALEYAKANPSVGLKAIARKFNCCCKHITTWRSSESKRRHRKIEQEREESALVARGVKSLKPKREKWCAIVDGEAVDPRSVRDVEKIDSFMLVVVLA